MKNATNWIAAISAAVVAVSIIAAAIKNPFARVRQTIDALRTDLHGEIAKVDAKLEGVLKESRSDMKHMRGRVNGLEANLRDRMGWIEGFLTKSTEAPDKYDYSVRETGRSKPGE
jgi:hypothetical protein